MKKIHVALGISCILFSVSVVFISCKKEQVKAVAVDTLQEPRLPELAFDYQSKHGVNSSLATLGRVLFYDKNLSGNKAISCGSCHKQEFAFADNVKFNKGSNGLDLKRNSPSIQGIKGFGAGFDFSNVPVETQLNFSMPDKRNQLPVLLFWDGRQNNMADMVLNPVLNHNEMNMPDFTTLVDRLSATSYYAPLFNNAFGDQTINKERVAFALEGFLSCLNTSTLNPGDRGFSSNSTDNLFPTAPGSDVMVDDPDLTPLENQGRFLFHNKYNCAQCHDPSNSGSYGSVTSPSQMFNIGLDEVYSDNGLGALTNKAGDKGLFKVPTLKNISLTAPYMHDGRFANLGEVIDHYSHSIKANANLSPRFLETDGTPKKLNILPVEKSALIAFLNTLKDNDFLTSPMYSDPFKK